MNRNTASVNVVAILTASSSSIGDYVYSLTVSFKFKAISLACK